MGIASGVKRNYHRHKWHSTGNKQVARAIRESQRNDLTIGRTEIKGDRAGVMAKQNTLDDYGEV